MPSNPLKRGTLPGRAPVPFAQEDLARAFDQKTLQRGRALILRGAVALRASAERIEATVADFGRDLAVVVTPVLHRHVYLERSCACGRTACAHMAAAAMHALETRPEWRRPVQASLLDLIAAPPPRIGAVAASPAPPELSRVARWTIEPGREDVALFVTAELVPASDDARHENPVPAAPCEVVDRVARGPSGDADRTVARLLGAGRTVRTPVPKSPADAVDRLIGCLAATRRLRWHDGTALAVGPARIIRAFRDPESRKVRATGLPRGGALIKGTGYWCVDPGAGRVSPVKLQVVDAPRPVVAAPPPAGSRAGGLRDRRPGALTPARLANASPATIVERTPRVVVRLGRVVTPHEGVVDTLRVAFDYGEPDGQPAEIESDDQRQFARTTGLDGRGLFVRRDKEAERAALDELTRLGFAELRLEAPAGLPHARGARVHRLMGPDAGTRWNNFLAAHVPALEARGWSVMPDAEFSTRTVEADVDAAAVAVRDAGDGWFDLEVGVEIDGERHPLLPILAKLIGRGGMEAARASDGRARIVLDDGSVLSLPADRVERLLSVLEAMIDSGGRPVADTLRVPLAEADALLDIDDLVARRPDESARIDRFLRRFRETETLPEVAVPAGFRGELRPYQRTGLAWLQNLRAQGMGGILADDMGLGKTAQTLAHIAAEHEAGRLVDPCLVVVPTSLVPNWVSEAGRFTPRLRVLVLHGLDRHERHRRDEIAAAHIVITTYGVVARDVERMKGYEWHALVLDEAQAIKNPDAKATRALCSLRARHRLCLSGTPVENNLGELWSQFAFLMPGLLGDRKEFRKRFRTPIEKRGDATRAALLWRRTRPFLLRRTKSEVATELPPKTEVIRRVELGPAQRDLYETIRLSVHERVREAIAASGLARSAITVIDALLKLRQACCDPRLVKIAAAATVEESAKLDGLVAMVREMVPEGRRILIFSQFTSMLDLIKPELGAAGIDYVELTGRTADRATPVERFQRGEAPVFLISLKAGGRGLNLTAADTVIHYDPWWNPAAEAQAADRAHRIGQDKPVFVYKLIAADTVEERILELQRRKGRLTAAAIDGAGLAGAMEGGDIDFLFGAAEGGAGAAATCVETGIPPSAVPLMEAFEKGREPGILRPPDDVLR